MRESLMYGSVRGTRGNSRPYRDWLRGGEGRSARASHRVSIAERDGQLVLRDDRSVRTEAEEALRDPVSHLLTNSTQVAVISRTLVGVALVAERLEVREVVAPAVPSGQDVIELQPSLIRWDATQLAAEASTTHDRDAHLRQVDRLSHRPTTS